MTNYQGIKSRLKRKAKENIENEKILVANDYIRQLSDFLDIQEDFDKQTAVNYYMLKRNIRENKEYAVTKLNDDNEVIENYLGQEFITETGRDRFKLRVRKTHHREIIIPFNIIENITVPADNTQETTFLINVKYDNVRQYQITIKR